MRLLERLTELDVVPAPHLARISFQKRFVRLKHAKKKHNKQRINAILRKEKAMQLNCPQMLELII